MNRFSSIQRVAETGSTNDDMAKRLGDDDARGLTLVADFQTRGAGRKGRAWIAPRGSALLFTTALPEPLPASDLWIVPFWIALAIRAALHDLGIDVTLQWPNDLLLHQRKAGGILCISRITGAQAWAACGVGLNVLRPNDDAELREIAPPPAFLNDAAPVTADDVLASILSAADRSYADLRDPPAVARMWEIAAGLPDARYRVQVDGERYSFEGTALKLETGGALLMECRGRRRSITLADARVLRGKAP